MPVYCSCTYWTFEIKIGSIRPTVLSSVRRLCKCFLRVGSLGFSEFWHVGRTAHQVLRESDFFKKLFFALQIGEMDQYHTKNRVF